ncbi:hypothetical protein L2E82_43862 [Cichorium intybus]|uniref:Uncharacterized protein n=1 Tax=Cichorium intybus TaxID=13427 RepID=A0ACB8ZPB7_CICIN|nr:hypothetical protein L2E82_43862 [Cichorium intybus]
MEEGEGWRKVMNKKHRVNRENLNALRRKRWVKEVDNRSHIKLDWRVRQGMSYRDVVSKPVSSSCVSEGCSVAKRIVIPGQVEIHSPNWLENCLVGEIKEIELLSNFFSVFQSSDIADCSLKYMGGLLVAIVFESKSIAEAFLSLQRDTWSRCELEEGEIFGEEDFFEDHDLPEEDDRFSKQGADEVAREVGENLILNGVEYEEQININRTLAGGATYKEKDTHAGGDTHKEKDTHAGGDMHKEKDEGIEVSEGSSPEINQPIMDSPIGDGPAEGSVLRDFGLNDGGPFCEVCIHGMAFDNVDRSIEKGVPDLNVEASANSISSGSRNKSNLEISKGKMALTR